jgi:hypothetical protein
MSDREPPPPESPIPSTIAGVLGSSQPHLEVNSPLQNEHLADYGEVKNTFDRFTGRTRKLLAASQEEAARFNRHSIGTGHLLLGLLKMGEGVPLRALTALGVAPERLRAAVEQAVVRGEDEPDDSIGLTSHAKAAIRMAIDEAGRDTSKVCSEHVLLGLCREQDGTAAKVLTGFNLSLQQVRTEVGRLLAPRPKSGALTRDNVVMCRLNDSALDALDTLVEARISTTRSAAAAWLIQAGIEAHAALFEQVAENVAQIRRLREETRQLGQELAKVPSVASASSEPTVTTQHST